MISAEIDGRVRGNIRDGIRWSFAKDTCYPGDWDAQNPSKGHCKVASLVAAKLTKARIIKVSLEDSSTHYYNRLASIARWDLTDDQFPPEKANSMSKERQVSIKEVLQDPNIKRAFPLLLRRTLENYWIIYGRTSNFTLSH